jgi:isopenicillin N synthase-like dioxygenase
LNQRISALTCLAIETGVTKLQFIQELLPRYKDVTLQYIAAATRLGMQLLRLVARALELPADFFDPMFDRPMLFLRPLHYIPRRSQPKKARPNTAGPLRVGQARGDSKCGSHRTQAASSARTLGKQEAAWRGALS